jgi:hypothetical protein
MWTSSKEVKAFIYSSSLPIALNFEYFNISLKNNTQLQALDFSSISVDGKPYLSAHRSWSIALKPIIRADISIRPGSRKLMVDLGLCVGNFGKQWVSMSATLVKRNMSFPLILTNPQSFNAAGYAILNIPQVVSSFYDYEGVNVTLCNIFYLCNSQMVESSIPSSYLGGGTSCEQDLHFRLIPSRWQSGTAVVFGDILYPCVAGASMTSWLLLDPSRNRSSSDVDISWQLLLLSSTSSQIITTETQKDPQIFRMPAGVVCSNCRYTLTMIARRRSTGVRIVSNSIEIESVASSLRAVLLPNQQDFYLPLHHPIELDGSKSMDPDNPSDTSSVNYAWKCSGWSEREFEHAIWGRPFCGMDWKYVNQSQYGRSRILLTNSNSALVNTTISIMFTVFDSSFARNSSISARIHLTPATGVPIITIMSQPTQLQNVADLNQGLSIAAYVQLPLLHSNASHRLLLSSNTSSTVSWIWPAKSNGLSNLIVRNQSLSLKIGMGEVLFFPLRLKPNSLQPGSIYIFQLVGPSIRVEVVVSANAPPKGGEYAVAPSDANGGGIAMTTLFSLSAMGWVDDNDDLPLQYSFEIQTMAPSGSSAVIWTKLPSITWMSYITELVFPSGLSSKRYHLFSRCQISDKYGAISISNIQSVQVSPYYASSLSTRSQLDLVQTKVQGLLGNMSLAPQTLPVIELQRFSSMLSADLRPLRTNLTASTYLSYTRSLLTILNSTLSRTDALLLPTTIALKQLAIQDVNFAIRAETKEKALSFLKQSIRTSNSSANQTVNSPKDVVSSTDSIIDMLTSTLLSNLLQGDSSTAQRIDIVSNSTRLAFVLVKLPSDNNTSSYPTINIPESSTTVAIQQAGSGGGALISVVEMDSSLWGQIKPVGGKTNSSGSSGPSGGSIADTVAPVLSSDIISIRLVFDSNVSTPIIPSFVANMSVSLPDSATFNPPAFTHNCTIGVEEKVHFLCPGSWITFNLTCSGKAAARVRRTCPVPRQVCNVLNLVDLSVASNDFCTTIQGTGSSVMCKCGFGGSKNGSSILAANGAVNVGVLTVYVPNKQTGEVSIAASAFSGNIAEESRSIFIAFGTLWATGVLLLVGYVIFDNDQWVQINNQLLFWKKNKNNNKKPEPEEMKQDTIKRRHANVLSIFPAPKAQEGGGAAVAVATSIASIERSRLHEYFIAIFPTIFHPNVSWWERCWHELCVNHKYIHIVYVLLFEKDEDRDDEDASSNSTGLVRHSTIKRNKIRANRHKEVMLDMFELLTATTLSCFILAVLYDWQYPTDDGSCQEYLTEAACLHRKSFLDQSATYCNWENRNLDSAGAITESRMGQLLDSSALEVQANKVTAQPCIFNDRPSTIVANILSILLASMVSAPVAFSLDYIFDILRSPSQKELNSRLLAKKVVGFSQSLGKSEIDDIEMASRGIHSDSLPQRPHNNTAQSNYRHRNAITPLSLNTAVLARVSEEKKDISAGEHVSLTTLIYKGSAKMWYEYLTKARDSSVVHSAKVPHRVHHARKLLFAATRSADLLDNKMHSHRHRASSRFSGLLPNESGHNGGDVVHLRSAVETRDVNKGDISNSRVKQAESLRQRAIHNLNSMLSHASDEEYAMILLQNYIADLLGRENTLYGRFFLNFVKKEFEVNTFASERLQWMLTGFVIILNLGSLYFVALKGVGRGYSWQTLFLRSCLLEWLGEILFYHVVEIYWVDIVIPSLVRSKIEAIMRQVCRMGDSFLVVSRHNNHKNKNKSKVTDDPSTVLGVGVVDDGDGDDDDDDDDDDDNGDDTSMLTNKFARAKPHLWESKFILNSIESSSSLDRYARSTSSGESLVPETSKQNDESQLRQHSLLRMPWLLSPRWMNKIGNEISGHTDEKKQIASDKADRMQHVTLQFAVLNIFSYMPVSLQRFVVYIFMTMVFSAIAFAYHYFITLGGKGIGLFTFIVIILFAAVVSIPMLVTSPGFGHNEEASKDKNEDEEMEAESSFSEQDSSHHYPPPPPPSTSSSSSLSSWLSDNILRSPTASHAFDAPARSISSPSPQGSSPLSQFPRHRAGDSDRSLSFSLSSSRDQSSMRSPIAPHTSISSQTLSPKTSALLGQLRRHRADTDRSLATTLSLSSGEISGSESTWCASSHSSDMSSNSIYWSESDEESPQHPESNKGFGVTNGNGLPNNHLMHRKLHQIDRSCIDSDQWSLSSSSSGMDHK